MNMIVNKEPTGEIINLRLQVKLLELENERLVGLIESTFRMVIANYDLMENDKWKVTDLEGAAMENEKNG